MLYKQNYFVHQTLSYHVHVIIKIAVLMFMIFMMFMRYRMRLLETLVIRN